MQHGFDHHVTAWAGMLVGFCSICLAAVQMIRCYAWLWEMLLRKVRFVDTLLIPKCPYSSNFCHVGGSLPMSVRSSISLIFEWAVWLGHILKKLRIVQKAHIMQISALQSVSREKENCLLKLKGSVWLERAGFSASSLLSSSRPLPGSQVRMLIVSLNWKMLFALFLMHPTLYKFLLVSQKRFWLVVWPQKF